LKTDVSEQHNLAGEQPQKTRQIHDKLLAWRNEIGAAMPTPNIAGEDDTNRTRRKRNRERRTDRVAN